MKKNNNIKPCIIGLGYVGLPIFVNLSKNFKTCGFDISKKRIDNLKKKIDTNLEYTRKNLILKNGSYFTNDKKKLKESNFYIITVPTPITKRKKPDLRLVNKAIKNISNFLNYGDILILESTVYPGVTEEYCAKILNKFTKLKLGKDFFVGYSPERINPGDKKHSLNKISKIVAFSDKKNLGKVKYVYKNLGNKIIYTKNIKEAETAKVVENIQRDLNIALINEIFIFCKNNNLDFKEVVRLASTKWNFIKFYPGLVGGHCLPVDPYYFSFIAKKKNQITKVTLAGRNTNNYMPYYVSKMIIKNIKLDKNYRKKRYLIAGLTYKPNVPDIRNSLALKVFKSVKNSISRTDGFDPYIKSNKMNLKRKMTVRNYEKIFVLTKHNFFKNIEFRKNKKFVFLFDDL